MESNRIIGTQLEPDKNCSFRVWAPTADKVELKLLSPVSKVILLTKSQSGHHEVVVSDMAPGTRYTYRLDGSDDRPDPASRFQPEGVHGPSEIIARDFPWTDHGWFGIPLRDYIIYELHVGTFTPDGTFDAIIPNLPALKELGITAIELMPVAQFPGSRNWGYDGVGLYAVQNSYGGPDALKRLIDACHQQGVAVILDVVYNHLGPEGNYLSDFGPYFTDRYSTPWGRSLNFDGPESDGVREFFLQNALYWLTEFHIDALRLDAVHAINDFSATPFLQELAAETHRRAEQLNRRFFLIAENDLNNPRYALPEALGGYGLDAQWCDDFHHALHVSLTDEHKGYYADFQGADDLAKAFRDGYVYTGQHSQHRRRKHGSSTRLNSVQQFVVCSQNHDQIGNRFKGDRLTASLPFDALKLAAATVLLSPFVPLLFMGEEYGEPAPFQYFISHTDEKLVEAVRKGRREEFASFGWTEEVPDPQGEQAFLSCKLNHELAQKGHHQVLRSFYRRLIRLRKVTEAIREIEKENIQTHTDPKSQTLCVHYATGHDAVCLVFNFGKGVSITALSLPPGKWRKILDSSAQEWGGPGTTVPDNFTSDGICRLSLESHTALAFQKT